MKKTLKMNILFICKHNRFRSKVAEAIFKKYNKNKKIKVESRGIIKDIDAADIVVKVLKEKGIKLRDRKSRPVRRKEILEADKIVIVADDVPKSLFKGKKVLVWKIPDVNQNNYSEILKRIKVIEKKILALLKSL